MSTPTPNLSGTAAVLLAAGKGTRMRSHLPKPLVPLAGRGLTLRLLDAVVAAGIEHPVVVVGHGAEQVRAALPAGTTTAFQAVRDGTASAVDAAREAVADAEHVFVLVGDSPLLQPERLRALYAHHRATSAACTFLTATFPVSYPYARVMRAPHGEVVACIEERDCTPEQAAIRELLTSHYVFEAEALWSALARVAPHPETGERYLTDVIELIGFEGAVEALVIDDWRELVGLNTPEDVAWAEGVLRDRG